MKGTNSEAAKTHGSLTSGQYTAEHKQVSFGATHFFLFSVGRKNHIANSGKAGETCDLGVSGVWGVFFIIDIMTRICRKLHRIILLHLGLIPFRIHDWKPEK